MNLRKLREKTGLNQTDFWTRIGISQSGGSRYENENRNIPNTIGYLLTIAYGDEKEFKQALRQLRQ